MDHTHLAQIVKRISHGLPESEIEKGAREFPEVGAYNSKAWEYFLNTSERTVRETIDEHNVPYKVYSRDRFVRPIDLWEATPWENAPVSTSEKGGKKTR